MLATNFYRQCLLQQRPSEFCTDFARAALAIFFLAARKNAPLLFASLVVRCVYSRPGPCFLQAQPRPRISCLCSFPRYMEPRTSACNPHLQQAVLIPVSLERHQRHSSAQGLTPLILQVSLRNSFPLPRLSCCSAQRRPAAAVLSFPMVPRQAGMRAASSHGQARASQKTWLGRLHAGGASCRIQAKTHNAFHKSGQAIFLHARKKFTKAMKLQVLQCAAGNVCCLLLRVAAFCSLQASEHGVCEPCNCWSMADAA